MLHEPPSPLAPLPPYPATYRIWQPTSLYHDDHHKLFHVNYGQTFTLWDRLGGTFYSPKRSYGETSFSW
jgi:sterol desaturase/sphingolipid hydroxylase (fatty acid hydroxylase superfamily)